MRLERALSGAMRAPRPAGLDDVAAELGGNPGIAAWLSGSTDKRSREYRSALRRVQRWRTTGAERRRPPARELGRLRDAAQRRATRERRQELRRGGSRELVVKALVRVSRDRRRRTIHGQLSAEAWGDILDLVAEGDREGAGEAFAEAFGQENGFGSTPDFEDVDFVDASL